MSITYAGHPLLLGDTDGDLAAWIDRYLDLDDMRSICDYSVAHVSNRPVSRGPGRVGIARPNYPPPPRPRINSLYWPSGASRWSHGLFLADAETVEKIGDSSQGATLRLADDEQGGGSITASMRMLSPRPIASPGGEASLYLLPLVDERYYWQFAAVGELDDINSWEDLFEAIGEALGVSLFPGGILYDTIPDPHEIKGRYHDNAAVLLDAVCHSLGLRLIRTLDGTITLQNADEAGALIVAAENGIAGGMNGGTFRSRWMPDAVSVSFPRWRFYHEECDGERYLATKTAASAAGQSGMSGTDRTIHVAAFADFTTGSGTPVNTSDVEALAQKIAEDQLLWTSHEYDFTAAGLLNWEPLGFDDHVLWLFGSQQTDGGDGSGSGVRYQAQTRVQSVPMNFGVDEMPHQFDDKPAVQSPIQFLLNAQLSAGGSASATILDADEDKTITLYDNKAAQGLPNSTKGWMVYVCERNRWEPVGAPSSGSGVEIVKITAADGDMNGLYAGKIVEPDEAGDFDLTTPYADGADIWIATLLQDHMVLADKHYIGTPIGTGGTPTRNIYLVKDELQTARYIHFHNGSGYTVPPYGCMVRVPGDNFIDSQLNLVLDRPGEFYAGAAYYFNGPTAVQSNAQGICTQDWPAIGLTNGAWTQKPGDPVGPIKDSFSLALGHPGFLCQSHNMSDLKTLMVPWSQNAVYCKAVSDSPANQVAITNGGRPSQPQEIWAYTGSSPFNTNLKLRGSEVLNETGRDIRTGEMYLATFACGIWRVGGASGCNRLRLSITSAGGFPSGTVSRASGGRYAVGQTVQLSNPGDFELEIGMMVWATDYGSVVEIDGAKCAD